MIDKQSKYELAIFKSFATVCALPIITKSIEKRDPPEPDVKCNVEGGGTIAFELTELIDRGFANMLGKQIDTKTELEKHYNLLENRERQKIFIKYSDAIIFIHFENSLSLRQRKQLFPNIFKHLLSLNDSFEGNTLDHDPKFKGKLKWITVSRGVNGPIFDDVPVSAIGDPTVTSIKAKFLKKYSTKYPLHLLSFIDLNPMFPDHIWLPSASEYTKKILNSLSLRNYGFLIFRRKKLNTIIRKSTKS